MRSKLIWVAISNERAEGEKKPSERSPVKIFIIRVALFYGNLKLLQKGV